MQCTISSASCSAVAILWLLSSRPAPDSFDRPIFSRPSRSSGWNSTTSMMTPVLMTCRRIQLNALSCITSLSHAIISTSARPFKTEFARVWRTSAMT